MWGIGRIEAAYNRAVAAGRRRSAAFDHFWRARQRYLDVLGGRLAAAIAYHAFFAAFALALVAYSVLGYLLDLNFDLLTEVDRFLRQNLPWLNSDEIKGSRGTVGVVGLIGVALTGIGWIESLRSSQRLIWGVQQQPGNPVIRRLIDLGMLLGLFVLLGTSLVTVDAIEGGLETLQGSRTGVALGVASWILTVLLNLVLATALLIAIPRLRIPARRLVPSLIMVGAGITLLNTVGRFFIARSAAGPVYRVVAGSVGLLVYLYLFNQVLLLGAALAATNPYGRVVDLATGKTIRGDHLPPDNPLEEQVPRDQATEDRATYGDPTAARDAPTEDRGGRGAPAEDGGGCGAPTEHRSAPTEHRGARGAPTEDRH
ncbi:MAG: YihY/virulence factor BrkB family protein [Micromonosporaceae bacterium]|nr:YihY/virulence factor BrkB family protein [Micromonosporaceae bacterium]